MIAETKLLMAFCDNCKENHNAFAQNEEKLLKRLKDDSWIIEEDGMRDPKLASIGSHYCPKCWYLSNPEGLVIDKTRFKPDK